VLPFISKRENIGAIIIAICYIVLNAVLTANEVYWLNLLPAVFLVVYLAFFKMDWLYFLIIAVVPISVPLHEIVSGIDNDIYIPSEIILAGTLLVFIIKVIKERSFDNKILKHPVTISILVFLFWTLITAITSNMFIVSIKFFINRLWFIVTFYFIATQVFQRFKKITLFFLIFAVMLIPVIAYTITRLSAEGLLNFHAANWTCKPFFADHTSYAGTLSMILIALIGLILLHRKASNSRRLFYVILIAIYAVALVLSYTRASWVSVFAALAIAIPLILRINLQKILIFGVILVSLFLIYRVELIIKVERYQQTSSGDLLKHLKSVVNITNDNSNLERVNRWKCAIKMFEEKPIFGWGPGTYMFQYAPFQEANDLTKESTNAGRKGNAHSEYLGPLAESGFLGSLSFIAIVFTTLFTANKLFFKAKRRKVRWMALTLMIALLSYYVHGLLNNFLDTDKLSALFWGFTAAIVALDVYQKKGKEPEVVL